MRTECEIEKSNKMRAQFVLSIYVRFTVIFIDVISFEVVFSRNFILVNRSMDVRFIKNRWRIGGKGQIEDCASKDPRVEVVDDN